MIFIQKRKLQNDDIVVANLVEIESMLCTPVVYLGIDNAERVHAEKNLFDERAPWVFRITKSAASMLNPPERSKFCVLMEISF
jgi:hypothetical protein